MCTYIYVCVYIYIDIYIFLCIHVYIPIDTYSYKSTRPINHLRSLTDKEISEIYFTYRSVQISKILFQGFNS